MCPVEWGSEAEPSTRTGSQCEALRQDVLASLVELLAHIVERRAENVRESPD
jgi:hypothetical protein